MKKDCQQKKKKRKPRGMQTAELLTLCAEGTCYGSKASCFDVYLNILRSSDHIAASYLTARRLEQSKISTVRNALDRSLACFDESPQSTSPLDQLFMTLNEPAAESKRCRHPVNIGKYCINVLRHEMNLFPSGVLYAPRKWPDKTFVVFRLNEGSLIALVVAFELVLSAEANDSQQKIIAKKAGLKFKAEMAKTLDDLIFIPGSVWTSPAVDNKNIFQDVAGRISCYQFAPLAYLPQVCTNHAPETFEPVSGVSL